MPCNELVRPARLERATSWFVARRSIQLSYGRDRYACASRRTNLNYTTRSGSAGPPRPVRHNRHVDAVQQHKSYAPTVVGCFVLTVSDTRTEATDTSGRAIRELLTGGGHTVTGHAIVRDEPTDVAGVVRAQLANPATEVVITTGGTGITSRDGTFEAVDALLEKRLTGFGELFRMLSYEDMGTSSDAKYESKTVGNKNEGGRNFILIENTPKGESSYGKTIIWVEEKTYLVGKIEYFDKKNKPLKVSTLSSYKKYDNVWRAQKIQVSNLQNKRGTVLELSGLKLNKGLDDGEFTESALTEGD